MTTSKTTNLQAASEALRDGLAARRKGDIDEARTAYERALEVYEAAGARERAVVVRANLGALEHQAGRLEAAAIHLEQGLELARELDDTRRLAVCAGNLAAIHLEQGRDEAEALLHDALTHYRELDEPAGIGNQLGNLGMLYQNRGEYDRAAACLAEAGAMFERAGHAIGAAGTLRICGELYRRLGNIDDAADAFERALVLSREVDDTRGEAYARRAIGQLRLAEGAIDVAIGHFRTALSLHGEAGDARGLSAAQLDLGQALVARGEVDDGLAALERSVALAREHALAPESLASALLAHGTQLAHAGQPRAGLDALVEALGIYTDRGDPHGSCAAYLNRASVLLLLGRWSEVEGTLDEATTIAEQAGLAPILPSISALRGQLTQLRGDYPRALGHFSDAVRGFEAVNKGKLAASARIAHAMMCIELGQIEEQREPLEEIAAAAAERGDHGARADALQTLARLARFERRFDDAIARLEGALEVAAASHNPSTRSGLLMQRAVVRMRQDDWQNDTYRQLGVIDADLTAAAEIVDRQGFVPRRAVLQVWQAEAARRSGELARARALLDEARATAERLGYDVCRGLAWHIDAHVARDERDAQRFVAAFDEASEILEGVHARALLDELYEDFGREPGADDEDER